MRGRTPQCGTIPAFVRARVSWPHVAHRLAPCPPPSLTPQYGRRLSGYYGAPRALLTVSEASSSRGLLSYGPSPYGRRLASYGSPYGRGLTSYGLPYGRALLSYGSYGAGRSLSAYAAYGRRLSGVEGGATPGRALQSYGSYGSYGSRLLLSYSGYGSSGMRRLAGYGYYGH